MMDVSRRGLLTLAGGMVLASAPALAVEISDLESPLLRERVAAGTLPPLAERLPRRPLTVDLASRNRVAGRHGGTLRTFAARTADLRHVTVYGYARLVGYDEKLTLQPDILDTVEVQDGRIFTFTLREGHRWSDGAPFTTEDFRYYWEDIANNKELSPSGINEVFLVDGKPPRFEVLDTLRVRFSWERPHPRFLPHLAQPRPVFIYAPAHYLKPFHARYGDRAKLDEAAKAQKLRSWAALHNRLEEPYENTNPAMPVLAPWMVVTAPPASRFIFERNPFYHRVDPAGRQLPYIDRLAIDIVAPSLFAAKANAGEADLLMRGISTSDVPVLKEGERLHPYRTHLWRAARGSTYALYPNLNVSDPVWRALNRDVRYRRALSLGLDRRLINNALLFGLGTEGNNTVDAASPLFSPKLRTLHAGYNPDEANRLLDEIGLTERDSLGIRLLPDGRRLEIILEVDGEQADMIDALQLVEELWRDIGIKLFVKPQDRTVLRNRSFAGQTVMVAMTGLDNAVPTPLMPPVELAPMRQTHYAWPKWGQFAETKGAKGEPIDMPEARRLMELFHAWMEAPDEAAKAKAWAEMLAIHAEQQFVIGTVAGDLQPIVVSTKLRNVPKTGLFSWEPTSYIGIYRPDEFFFVE
jgi:peptide/nickel transport system substrate-binding protein